jgi:hypothetical protein
MRGLGFKIEAARSDPHLRNPGTDVGLATRTMKALLWKEDTMLAIGGPAIFRYGSLG